MAASVATYLRGCAMYLMLFMGYGAIDPFMPLIWRCKGMSGEEKSQNLWMYYFIRFDVFVSVHIYFPILTPVFL